MRGRDPVAGARAGEASETRARRGQGRTCRRRARRLERRPRGGAAQRSARLQRPLPETRAPGKQLDHTTSGQRILSVGVIFPETISNDGSATSGALYSIKIQAPAIHIPALELIPSPRLGNANSP
uniref:uncharacterized protein LOC114677702 isoform X1 n=1 Tax=Macaca mulatta TaxID=9544 RepID=UPI0010A294A8|nr:uncharacterized protein LOC114677702 isoform X1 [Macaca mulatta]